MYTRVSLCVLFLVLVDVDLHLGQLVCALLGIVSLHAVIYTQHERAVRVVVILILGHITSYRIRG